jgi:hypothetical protein
MQSLCRVTQNHLRRLAMKFRLFAAFFGAFLCSLSSKSNPVISSFTPTFGASNDPGNITITGSGFYPGTLVVKFNGAIATVATPSFDGTTITTHVPTGAPQGAGSIFVSVNGLSTLSGDNFTVIGPGPYVDSFSPGFGSGGTSVSIYGAHFFSSTAVKFNGVNALSFFASADGLITVVVSNAATTGPITIEHTGVGTNTTATNFFVPPIIKSFSPITGKAGMNVVIHGTNFTGATGVRFNNQTTTQFSVDSNFQITVPVPAFVSTGPIRVDTPANNPAITSSNFTVLPTILGFTPGFGPPNTSVTVTGANFIVGNTTVKFGSITAGSVTVNNASNLTVSVPSTATNGPVTVTIPSGSDTSSQVFFLPPRITSFTPTNGGLGTSVKISGTNFWPFVNGVTAVSFNGTPAASFVVSNNNTIGAIVPDGVITGPISVTTPGGTSNSVAPFYGPPTITTFSPISGAPGSTVQINGTNFLGATAVLFNGTNASFAVTNNNVIGAKVPTNFQSGSITVITPGGTNTSTGTFTAVFTSDLNVGVTDLPDPVFIGSNLVYTIIVANAGGPDAALNVMLTNKLPASVTLKSASSSQGALDTNSNPVIVIGSLGTIAKNGTATVTLTVIPQSAGWITNIATIGSDSIDPTLNDHTNIVSTLVWPLPILSINLTNTQIKVSWPAALSNFDLLFKTNLFPATSWTTDQTARVLTATDISVTETNTGTEKFFRLRQ